MPSDDEIALLLRVKKQLMGASEHSAATTAPVVFGAGNEFPIGEYCGVNPARLHRRRGRRRCRWRPRGRP